MCERFPDAPVMGLSATPYRPSDGGRDMGEEFFGGIYAAKMLLPEGWADPAIPLDPPIYVVSLYDTGKDLARLERRAARLGGAEQAAMVREVERLRRALEDATNVGDVLARHLPRPDGRYLFFCAGVEHMRRMMAASRAWFREVNPRLTYYELLHTTKDPSGVLQCFASNSDGTLKVLFSVDKLNEGIHCDVDGVVLARPTDSSTVYMQQVGRALDVGGAVGVVIDLVDNLSAPALVAKGIPITPPTWEGTPWDVERDVSPAMPFAIVDEAAGASRLISDLERKLDDLSRLPPALAAQWHPTRNGDLQPTDVTRGSSKRVWWVCGEGHEWQAAVCDRERSGCPYCSGRNAVAGATDLATTDPSVAAQWHPTLNGELQPTDVKRGSERKVWWLCEKGHEWQASPNNRTNQRIRSGCPYCAGKRVLPGHSDLATTDPALAAQWHPTRNGDLRPTEVTRGSSKRAWWVCEKGHEWQATVAGKVAGKDCPYCAGRRVLAGCNDLATTSPEASRLWHPTLNGDLQPTDVTRGSSKRVWWLCPDCGREWEAPVKDVARQGHKCGSRRSAR